MIRCTIFEKQDVTERAEEYGRKLAENGLCTVEKDNDYCLVIKAPARQRFNIFIPGIILQGRELTIYLDDNKGYLHLDEQFINSEYLLAEGGLNPLMSIELMGL